MASFIFSQVPMVPATVRDELISTCWVAAARTNAMGLGQQYYVTVV